MEQIILDNGIIKVTVDTYGGELQSLKRYDTNIEYLWQGNKDTYVRKAINIFPYVARLTEGNYYLDETLYEMNTHGFISEIDMNYEQISKNEVDLWVMATGDTMKVYPRRFWYGLKYRLLENTIEITYSIFNEDIKDMYFGLGGHPGFFLPLENGLAFEDYYLEFSEVSIPFRIGMSKTCFVLETDKKWDLEDERIQRLSHDMFDEDAIILRDMSKKVTLKSDKGTRAITVTYPQMDYLGIWHWPKTKSPYICIEPWSSLPSRQNIIEKLEEQKDLIKLKPGERYRNTWSITLW